MKMRVVEAVPMPGGPLRGNRGADERKRSTDLNGHQASAIADVDVNDVACDVIRYPQAVTAAEKDGNRAEVAFDWGSRVPSAYGLLEVYVLEACNLPPGEFSRAFVVLQVRSLTSSQDHSESHD